MPHIRCMFYESNGDPIGAGCPKAKCTFIHPKEEGWASASMSRNKLSRPGDHPGRRGSDNWTSSRPSFRDEDRRDKKQTGANMIPVGPRSVSGPSRSQASQAVTSSWDSWDRGEKKNATENTPAKDSPVIFDHTVELDNSVWGSSSNKAATEKPTWGNGSPAWGGVSGWGLDNEATSGSGWGVTGQNDATPAKSWGGFTDAISSTATNTNDRTTGSIDGGWPDVKGKQKAVDALWVKGNQNDSQIEDAWPTAKPTPPTSFKPLSDPATNLFDNKPTPRPPSQSRSEAPAYKRDDSRNFSPIFFDKGFVHDLLNEIRPDSPDRSARSTDELLSMPATPRVPSFTLESYEGPDGRVRLYRDIIEIMQKLVVLHVDVRKISNVQAQLRRTQASESYARATLGTRKILERLAHASLVKRQSIETEIRNLQQHLLALPPFSKQTQKMIPPDKMKDAAIAYTEELKVWFKEIMPEEKKLEEEPPAVPPGEEQPIQAANDEDFKSLTAELKEKGGYTWADVEVVASTIERRLLALAEVVNIELYTHPDVTAVLEGISFDEEIPPDVELPAFEYPSQESMEEFDQVSSGLIESASTTAEAIFMSTAIEAELGVVKSEIEAMDKLCAEAEERFREFDQWQKEDEATIRELTEDLRTLYVHDRERRDAWRAGLIKQAMDAQGGQILELLRPIVLEKLKEQIATIVILVQNQCEDAQRQLSTKVGDLIHGPLQVTNAICGRVMEIEAAEKLPGSATTPTQVPMAT